MADGWLNQFDLAFVPSNQSEGEYRILEELEAKLVEFVKNGGVLSMSTAGWGWVGGKPPTSMSVGSIAITSVIFSSMLIWRLVLVFWSLH